MKSIAHIREEDDCIQTVEAHLLEVKELAEQYGEKIGVKHIAGLAGLLHDIGKYSNQFVEYILKAVYEPGSAPKRGSVDHSTAGGRLLYEMYHKNDENNVIEKVLAEIVGNAIISHHSYLHDYLSPDLTSPYLKRVRDKEIEQFTLTKKMFFERVMTEQKFKHYISKAIKELHQFINKTTIDQRESYLMFLSKFIFSTLIDADRTNTRQFVDQINENESENRSTLLRTYYQKLMKRLSHYEQQPNAQHPINRLRARMSKQCEAFAHKKSGIYTLSIPTGGGKTLASLRYALAHAHIHNKKRIIYIVPYTTIIEQNAAEVRDVLGEEAYILEHHSNTIDDHINEDDIYISETQKRLMLAKDNWDAPIIFTTMVQFLNVFYAHGSRNIRRLHNLTESVLIFDEVQKVPIHCVSLFNQALNFLKKFGHSTIVLCTATQPALDFVSNKLEIEPDAEMIENIDNIIEQFKRVNVIDKASEKQFDKEKLLQFIDKRLHDSRNILAILNTKQVVKDLYEALKLKYDDIPIYHLSTSMCPSHRSVVLNKVRTHLKYGEQVICVSTQLIEAGVDISFECVIRSLAGLDSIAQAAGRCNRHGEVKQRNVYIIDYVEENLTHLLEILRGKDITKKMLMELKQDLTNHGGNILTPKAMENYFKQFYKDNEASLDYSIQGMSQTMVELLMASYEDNSLLSEYLARQNESSRPPLIINNSYRTAAKHFQVIDSPTTSIIVPYGEGVDLIADLNGAVEIEDLSTLFQKAQLYSVNVYPYQFNLLKENEQLIMLFDNQVYVLKEGAYDDEYGLNIEGDSNLQFYSF